MIDHTHQNDIKVNDGRFSFLGGRWMRKQKWFCFLFIITLISALLPQVLQAQETDSFTLNGTVQNVDGTVAGAGYSVVTENQRVKSGWLTEPKADTRADGTFTVSFLDIFGPNRTKVGDQLVITITEVASGKIKGKKTYTVTASDVENFETSVVVMLSGITTAFSPAEVLADGQATSSITVTIQDEGELVIDDTVSLSVAEGQIGDVANNGDGTYSAVYTAPFIAVDGTKPVSVSIKSTKLDQEVSETLILKEVPTVVTLIPNSTSFTASEGLTLPVKVTVVRGQPLSGETVTIESSRNDNGNDIGQLTGSIVETDVAGEYKGTFTLPQSVGKISLVAKAAGASSEAVELTINAGPAAKIDLSISPDTISSQGTGQITAVVTDAVGNGVGGLNLSVAGDGGGQFSDATETAIFGTYNLNYTAAVIESEGIETATATVADSDVSGQLKINLTPIPPKQVSMVVVSGTAYKKGGTSPIGGLSINVKIGDKELSTTSEPNGTYSVTDFNPVGIVAQTGDLVSVSVVDEVGQVRGQIAAFVLEEKYLDASEVTATITGQDVTTDIGARSNVLALAGTVFLEDGLTAVGDGLTVSINNSVRGKSEAGKTDENGAYSITLLDPLAAVAETDDVLSITITNLDGQTFETTQTLATVDVEAGKVNPLNITTDLLAVESRIFVIDGTVFLEDGATPARSGLQILVNINDQQQKTATETGAGYQVTFVDVLGQGILAKTGDEVKVEVTAVDLAEAKVVGVQTSNLKTAEIKAKRATIDVTTDLKAATKVLAITGIVTLENGQVAAPSGIKVSIENTGIAQSTNVDSDASGGYSTTFFDPLKIVAESGDILNITATDAMEETFQLAHTLTTAEVNSGQATVDLSTDLPARTSSLVVSGQVYLVGGEVKAQSGLSVSISVDDTTGTATTDSTGSYSVSLGDGTVSIAKTKSKVTVTINDGSEDRGSESERLTIEQVVAGQLSIDVATNLKQTTNVLAVSGSVILEDGVTLAGAGLEVSVKNTSTGISTKVMTESGGGFAATFFDPLSVVAETDNQIEVSVVDVDQSTYTQPHVITSKEALDGQVSIELKTPFPGRNTTSLISGTVYREGGEILAPSGLIVVASIGEVTADAITTNDGTYSLSLEASLQTGSQISFVVSDESGQRGNQELSLSTVQVVGGAAQSDIETNIGATTELLTITGQITAEDGSAVGSDVTVSATLRETTQTVSTESDGTYSIAFVNLVGIVAENGDMIRLVLSQASTGESADIGIRLSTKQVVDKLAVADVQFSGFNLSGTIVEADGKLLQTDSAVVINVLNTASGQTVQTNSQGGGYTAQFTTAETKLFTVGDTFEVNVTSVADSAIILGATSYVLGGVDLENKAGDTGQISVNRTTSYNIQGTVLDRNGDPASGAIVTATSPLAQVSASTNQNGRYAIKFLDFVTNPAIGDRIVLVTQVEGELARQTVVTAFETPTRVVTVDSIPMRLGGLSINSGQYRDFIDRLVAKAIEKTSVGKLLGDGLMPLVRNDPDLRKQMSGLLNSLLPGGLLPEQVLLNPDLPLVFADPENKDLENFGNGIVPSPLSGLIDGLGKPNMGLAPYVTSDKLDLYLSIPSSEVAKVEFELNGPQSGKAEAEKVTAGENFSHTFQFEEELAAAFLPAYPAEIGGQLFSSVTLRYASKDLPEPKLDEGPKTLEEQVQEKVDQVLSDVTNISDSATDVLGDLAEVELPADLQEQLGDISKQLDSLTSAASGGDVQDLLEDPKQIEAVKENVQDFLTEVTSAPSVPDDLKAQVTDLDKNLDSLDDVSNLASLAGGMDLSALFGARSLNRLIGPVAYNRFVAPPTSADYSGSAAMQPRQIGDQFIWETAINIEPAKIYYYYFEVEFVNPISVQFSGSSVNTISQWVMPDLRNMQLDDRGLVDQLLTPEVQDTMGPILDPLVSGIMGGGGASLEIAPADQDKLIAILTQNATAVYEDILTTLSPKLVSMFATPKIAGDETLWVAKFDFDANADGDYQLGAAAYDSVGNTVDQLTPKSFVLDRTAPASTLEPAVVENVGHYIANDGTHVVSAIKPGSMGVLNLHARPTNSQADLTGYLYYMKKDDNEPTSTWFTLPVPEVEGRVGASQLIAGALPGLGLESMLGALDTVPASVNAPHLMDMAVSLVEPGNYLVRAIGVDSILNFGANAVPTKIQVVAPKTDVAEIFELMIGGREGQDTIFEDTLDLDLKLKVISKTSHPLSSIIVNLDGNEVASVDSDALLTAEQDSLIDVSYTIDDYSDLLAAKDMVSLTVTTTNALGLSDIQTVELKLSEGLYPSLPEVLAIKVSSDETSIDSGAAKGVVSVETATSARTVPDISSVKIEIRRTDETEWTTLDEINEPVREGTQNKWNISLDTLTLDDTITGDSPAARDVSLDDNPYIVRATIIDVDGETYTSDKQATLSVDNVDDIGPVSTAKILSLSDAYGNLDVIDGTYVAGGLLAEGVESPIASVTASVTADPATFDSVGLFINGDLVEPLIADDNGVYSISLDLQLIENGSQTVSVLAVDEAGNSELATDLSSVVVRVENFTPPFASGGQPPVEILSIDQLSAADVVAEFPKGYPVATSFGFTLALDGVSADEIDVLIDGKSARELGLLIIDVVQANRSADHETDRTFAVSLDTSNFPEGSFEELEGVISKKNGQISFSLPPINVDRTAPVVTLLSPLAGHEVSPLPTIYAAYDDGTIGTGVNIAEIELIHLLIEESSIELDEDLVRASETRVVMTQETPLDGGAYQATVYATDKAGNVGKSTVEFVVEGSKQPDTTPPILAQTSPQGVVTSSDVTISVLASDEQSGIAGVNLTLDGEELGEGASRSISDLEDGTHQVVALVTNGDGLETSYEWTFSVQAQDTTAPVITAVSPQGIVKSSDVNLTVLAIDDQSGIKEVLLSVDDGKASKGSTLELKGLTPGIHQAKAEVTNGVGLSQVYTWTFSVDIDTSAPIISNPQPSPQSIVGDAGGQEVIISANITDEQSEISKITLRLDGSAKSPTTKDGLSVFAVSGLSAGQHKVELIATSTGGTSVLEWTFEIDNTPPTISSVAPQGVVRSDTVNVSAVVGEDLSKVTDVTVAVDGKSTKATLKDGSIQLTQSGLDSGSHTVTVTAQSVGGKTAHTWTFTVEQDDTPPQITVTDPKGTIRVEKPIISVSAVDDLSGIDSIKISLKNSSGKSVSGKSTGNGSSITFKPNSGLSAGTYTASAEVSDKSGNSTQAQWTFTVEFDTVPPVIDIVSPTGELPVRETRRPVISAKYHDAISGIDAKSVKISLDGALVIPQKTTSDQVIYTPQEDLSFGRHSVKVEVSDVAVPTPNKATIEWTFIVESPDNAATVVLNALNYPNPFKNDTTIAFSASRQAKVTIEIFDASMRLVRVLETAKVVETGEHYKKSWDGKTEDGESLARGVYFCQITILSELKPEYRLLKLALTR